MTERAQNADSRRKPQIFADSALLLEIPAFGGRRKPQKTADFRRKPQDFCRKPQETAGFLHRHLRCVTFSSALGKESRKPLTYSGSLFWPTVEFLFVLTVHSGARIHMFPGLSAPRSQRYSRRPRTVAYFTA